MQLVPAHAQCRQGGDKAYADDHVGQQGRSCVSTALAQIKARQHQHLQQAGQVTRQRDADADDDQRTYHVADADGHHAHIGAGTAGIFVEGDVVQVGKNRDQVSPHPVQNADKASQQGQADQAQGLLVDLFDVQGRLFDNRIVAFACFLGGLAFGQCTLVGQAPCRYCQATDKRRFDHQPEHQQIEGIDQAVAELERGVVVAKTHRHKQRQRQQGEGKTEQLAQAIGFCCCFKVVEQQAAEQPGHGRIATEHHQNTQDIVGQRSRLLLGKGDDGHQGQDHKTEFADPVLQERDQRFFPAKMQFGHATRRQNPVSGVEHQPGLGHLNQRRARIGIHAPGIGLQGVAAQGQRQ